MTVRAQTRTFTLVMTAAALAAPDLAAQNGPPDSLAWLGLPADPEEFPRLVAENELRAAQLFRVGCPSEGGWVGAAFRATEREAETEILVRQSLVSALGSQIRRRDRWGLEPQCPSELVRFEAWLAGQLRREWRDGLLATGSERPTLVLDLLLSLNSSTNPATHALVRGIARDSTVHEEFRNFAARFMVDHRFGASTIGKNLLGDPARLERYLNAYQSVLFDLATGPPLLEFEASGREILRTRRGVVFEREYERVLMEAGRIRR